MESGNIVEEGSPADLLAQGGAYARLHHRGEWTGAATNGQTKTSA
jgi:subfamily B ATP-binding cassette protein MsbA